eukprot:CAMPEP_0175078158 /NCGR_PEP_ID=MMETSP0052_2-20121109/23917_1 /TAXON_ID=51329 ORGANISM="Polytomella parva, Strain SAG 63-3" /NCGR_SAMPLE_ID=MMETSP0052_2 /ASSEMBLY_ACC=CAM_ASM_000194 /LENGTH=36 /DNA_ID= /DNA_START= /DNA_END= /DNA_ORIENTATION=
MNSAQEALRPSETTYPFTPFLATSQGGQGIIGVGHG